MAQAFRPSPALQTATNAEPAKSQAQKEEPPPSLPKTPAENLDAAKKQLSMKSANYPYGDIYHAAYLLSQIPDNAPEYKEAQALLKKVNKLKEKDLAGIREETAKDMRAKRILYAPLLETRFLDKGYDISVKILGKDATTLQLRYVLTTRVMVHHISKDAELIKTWRDMGFKKVIFTDGFRSKWIMDL